MHAVLEFFTVKGAQPLHTSCQLYREIVPSHLRMHCIDSQALVFILNKGELYSSN